jgi:hypothetical protein
MKEQAKMALNRRLKENDPIIDSKDPEDNLSVHPIHLHSSTICLLHSPQSPLSPQAEEGLGS